MTNPCETKFFIVVDEESSKTYKYSDFFSAYLRLIRISFEYRNENDYPNLYIKTPSGMKYGFGKYHEGALPW